MNNENEKKTDKKRRATWPKLLDLLLRVCHVGTSSVLFGGIIWAVPFARLSSWHDLTIVTGCALIISGICGSRHWPYQGRGLMAGLHIGLLWLVHARPATMLPVLVIVLIAGVMGSHLPGFIRHWSLIHWRRMD
jgi:hypothetical protein